MGCVYQAVNRVNGKAYIGRTIGSLDVRRRSHRGDAIRGSTFPFHLAIKKYGCESFEWSIFFSSDDSEALDRWEEHLIHKYKTQVPNGYNLCAGGHTNIPHAITKARMKGRKQSPESNVKRSIALAGNPKSEAAKANMRLAIKRKTPGDRRRSLKNLDDFNQHRKLIGVSDQHRENLRLSHLGNKHTPEQIAKIKSANKGRKRTEETKTRMRAAQVLRRQQERQAA